MERLSQLGTEDRILTGLLDQALAEAVRKSGSWLACRPGCFDCCLGPFGITQLDAHRLRAGLAALERRDPERAARVRERACAAEDRLAQRHSPADQPCPALDPEAGTCDLYSARPVICRTFGPPVRGESGAVTTCEKCFQGATDEEIAACSVRVDTEDMEARLISALEDATGVRGTTIVAACLAG